MALKDIPPDYDDLAELRTKKQNNAEHKWFRMIAEALNDAGYSVNDKQVIKLDIPFTEYVVKEFMFKRIAEAMTGKDSTAKLTKEETSLAIEVMNQTLADNWQIHVPFPHEAE